MQSSKHVCRCPVQNHETFGQCVRAKHLNIGYCRSATGGGDYTAQKRADKDLALYRQARKEGVQPDTTRGSDVRRALDVSDKTGRAYRAA